MDIFDFLTMLGGLSLFLFGMSVMGQGLERAAGSKLKTILERLTSSPVKGFFLGVVVTAVIQSSSATTVMVVGFVNSGVMKLTQAVGIIMGANVGTTVTAWLISLAGLEGDGIIQLYKPSSFSPILAVIGVVFYVFLNNSKKKDIGAILLGFATLMFGMETMSGAVAGLADVPAFTNILLMFSNPILGVLAGAVLTAIIQSSSASVGILQALSSTGAVTYGSAIPIIMGQNIGTTVTAMLSSVGANKNARRAALIHLYFNIIGTAVFLILFYAVRLVIDLPILNTAVNEAGIAIIHTTFNIVCTAVLLPFNKLLVKLACLTIRDEAPEPEVNLLDERLLVTPSIALEQCSKLSCAMANLSQASVDRALGLVAAYSEDTAKVVCDVEEQLDQYEDGIGTYLVKLSSKSLSMDDSRSVSRLLHSISDFERISDHAKSIQISAQRLRDKGQTFSKDAQAELEVLFRAVRQVTRLTANSFIANDPEQAKLVEPLEQVVDHLCATMKARHITRLQEGACNVDQGMLFTDLLTDCSRISDHCSNVAAAIIELGRDSYDTHHYLDHVREHDNQFKQQYQTYLRQFPLP